MAKSNVSVLGYLTDQELAGYYQKAYAFIFPQREDFGIAPVEAQAAGVPVIAYRAGGALDTVIEGKTGIFFENQTKDDLISAVIRFESMSFNRKDIRTNAERFSKSKFKRKFLSMVDKLK